MIIALCCYFITLAFALFFALSYYTHMFQLEAYLKKQFFKWLNGNFLSLLLKSAFFVISFFILLFNRNIISYAVCSVLNLAEIYLFKPFKAKKPLVYTARVKRLLATAYLLFAAASALLLIFDILFLLPLICVFCGYILILCDIINKPAEKAVRNRYINEAKNIIKSRKNNLTVIGITGSYGKTSTKYFLEKILSQKYNVLMTPASYNTTMGVVKTVREMLKPSHEIFICEMGARKTGEIKEICDIVLPDHGIITSIGEQHLETFGSIENIIKTKFELADSVRENGGGYIFLNGDNEYIVNRSYDGNTVYYGTSENASYKAENVKTDRNGTGFTVKCENAEFELSTRLLGSHNVQNILACVSAADKLGVDKKDIAFAVSRLEAVPHRLQIIDAKSTVIIDDSFNSNPSGAKAALDVLSRFDGARVLVTPGMVELGEAQDEKNTELGEYAYTRCDYLFVVGEYNKNSIISGAKKAGFDESRIFCVSGPAEAVKQAETLEIGRIKYVLLENDLPDNFR